MDRKKDSLGKLGRQISLQQMIKEVNEDLKCRIGKSRKAREQKSKKE